MLPFSLYILEDTCSHLSFHLRLLSGDEWNLTVVLICISVMTNDAKLPSAGFLVIFTFF